MKRDPSLLNLDAQVIRLANRFADAGLHNKEVYGAILIEPATPIKGAYVIGMDGSCVLVQYDPTATCKEKKLLCVSETMDSQLKEGRRLILTHDSKLLIRDPKDPSDRAYSLKEATRFVHLGYPKWRTVVPTEWNELKPGFPALLNAAYLQKIAQMHLDDQTTAPVRFYTGPTRTSCGPTAIVMFARNLNMFVVLAPMESDVSDTLGHEPSWLNPEDPTADL